MVSRASSLVAISSCLALSQSSSLFRSNLRRLKFVFIWSPGSASQNAVTNNFCFDFFNKSQKKIKRRETTLLDLSPNRAGHLRFYSKVVFHRNRQCPAPCLSYLVRGETRLKMRAFCCFRGRDRNSWDPRFTEGVMMLLRSVV